MFEWIMDGGEVRDTTLTPVDMPFNASQMCGGFINGTLYLHGGRKRVGNSQIVSKDTYKLINGVWEPAGVGISATFIPAFGIVNNKLLISGGLSSTSNRFPKVNEIYDPVTGWSSIDTGPPGRTAAGAFVHGDDFYTFGGYGVGTGGGSESRLSEHWKFDSLTETWTRLPNGPVPRNSYACGPYLDGYLVVGGLNSVAVATSTVFYYDTPTGEWRQLPNVPSARTGGVVLSVGGNTYIYGGSNKVYKLDPVTETWSVSATLPSVDERGLVIEKGGHYYVIGGTLDGKETNRFELLKPSLFN